MIRIELYCKNLILFYSDYVLFDETTKEKKKKKTKNKKERKLIIKYNETQYFFNFERFIFERD